MDNVEEVLEKSVYHSLLKFAYLEKEELSTELKEKLSLLFLAAFPMPYV